MGLAGTTAAHDGVTQARAPLRWPFRSRLAPRAGVGAAGLRGGRGEQRREQLERGGREQPSAVAAPAGGGGRPTFDNTTRTHEQGLRPCLTSSRSRLSHASCGMHTLARAHTQHSSQLTDGLRATPGGSHSSLCARAAAATKAELYPSRTTGKCIAAPARQLAPTCAANHRSPLIERFAMPARGARDQRTSSVGVVVGVHCIGLQ